MRRLEWGGVHTIGKVSPPCTLYNPARETAFTPQNIRAGFARTKLEIVLKQSPLASGRLCYSKGSQNLNPFELGSRQR